MSVTDLNSPSTMREPSGILRRRLSDGCRQADVCPIDGSFAVAHVLAMRGLYPSRYPPLSFSHFDQFLAMAFAQLTFRESLRDIEICLLGEFSGSFLDFSSEYE